MKNWFFTFSPQWNISTNTFFNVLIKPVHSPYQNLFFSLQASCVLFLKFHIEDDFFYCFVDNDNCTSLLFLQGSQSCSRFSVSKRTKYGRGEHTYSSYYPWIVLIWYLWKSEHWLIDPQVHSYPDFPRIIDKFEVGADERLYGTNLRFFEFYLDSYWWHLPPPLTICRSTNSHKIHVIRCSSSDT